LISDQRKMFVNEYIKNKCSNARQAAIMAGYSVKSAQSQASSILKDPEVKIYLDERVREIKDDLTRLFIFDALEARKVMYGILTKNDSEDKDKIAVAKDFLDRAGFKPIDRPKAESNIPISVIVNYDYGDKK